MRIAVCDDDLRQLELMRELLAKCSIEIGEAFETDFFTSGLDLLSSINDHYDIVVLDVMMPGIDGLTTAREIREVNESVSIIFLTSTKEYAVESYRVKAFDYILKPVEENKFIETIARAVHQHNIRIETLVIKLPRKTYSIPFSQIEFVEINNKTLRFHMIDRSDIEVSGHLADYEQELVSRKEFVKPHRSYIVNMNLMKVLDVRSFTTLTGADVPIARGMARDVKEAYMKHLFGAI